jgi:hypothetical protein
MATTNVLTQYGDTTKWIDVSPAIEYITPTEDYFFKNLRDGEPAESDVVEVMEDTLDTVASGAVSQEADFVYPALTVPTRRTNLVEMIVKPFKVGWVQQWIRHYHGQNEQSRQMLKKMKAWIDSVEYDLVRSTAVSGVSGTAPKMSGIIEAISKSTNTTAHNSGTTWAASILAALLKNQVDNVGQDNVATDVFMGSYLRDKTDKFSGARGATVYQQAESTNLIETIDTYQTAFGRVRFRFHRHVQISTDATGRVLGVRPETIEKSWLRKAFVVKPDSDSPADNTVIVGALSNRTRNQGANFFASGFYTG